VSFSAQRHGRHPFGPGSRELEDTVARQDDVLGALIKHLDDSVGRERYVLAVSADHGVADVPVTRSAGRVAQEDVRERIEELLITRFGPAVRKHPLHPLRHRLHSLCARRVRSRPRRVWPAGGNRTRRDCNSRSRPRVEEGSAVGALVRPIVRAAALTNFEGRSGDLIIVTKPNWPLGGRVTAEAGSHGAPYDYDQRVPVILFGAGIKAGRVRSRATPADIAPTLARVAGIQMPKAEGRALTEAIAQVTSTK
jgi:predicted AlkP superfamily pyrophosphatase or phosphodiesterase